MTLVQITHYTDHPQVNIHWILYWNIFHRIGFLSNLPSPWKTEFALKFFTALDILFTFRIFEQLCACPEIFQAGGEAASPRLVRLYWNLAANFRFSRKFWFLVPISKRGQMLVLWPPADAHAYSKTHVTICLECCWWSNPWYHCYITVQIFAA